MDWLFEKGSFTGFRWKEGEELPSPLLFEAGNLHAEGEGGAVNFEKAGLTAEGSFEQIEQDILCFTAVPVSYTHLDVYKRQS